MMSRFGTTLVVFEGSIDVTRTLASETGTSRDRRSRIGILALLLSLTLLVSACGASGGGDTSNACEYGAGTYGTCVYGS